MKHSVLITGSTGMVGKAVLYECLNHPQISTIKLLSRSPINTKNEKIQEIILSDFYQIETISDKLQNIDACFHCMGVSSVGLSEEEFMKPTFEITKKLANVCYGNNPDMIFNYVSGTGTDSTEQGKTMWARVKGKTENYILNRGFRKAYMFRPGFIIPEKGIRSRTKLYQGLYNIMRPFFPLLKKLKSVTTTTKIGQAMINTLIETEQRNIYLENRNINEMAK